MKQANTVPASSRASAKSFDQLWVECVDRLRTTLGVGDVGSVRNTCVEAMDKIHAALYPPDRGAKAKPVKGLGRWVYCKSCEKSHRPLVFTQEHRGKTYLQVVGECGYAYTPPLESIEELAAFLRGEEVAGA